MESIKAGIVPPSLAKDMPPAPPGVSQELPSAPVALAEKKPELDLALLPDEIDEETVKKILDQADEMHVEVLTEANLRRAVAQLERRIKKNQQDRIRHAEDPEKWIKSEVDLDEEIKRWKQLAADPALYPLFIEARGLELLLSLLNHSNQDIQLEVIDVLAEFTDADTLAECKNPQEILNKLVEHQLPELTVETLQRINEESGEDEQRGVSHCLSIVENLLESEPSLAGKFTKFHKLPNWLLRRVRNPVGGQPTAFDFNRLYASEILVVLLQNSAEARESLGAKQGGDAVDKLLRAVAVYRKRDPESSQEEEMAQNLFDALCSLLLVPANKELLGKQQGIELMLRIVKERRFFCSQAIKVLDFALLACPPNCQIFVEKLGLKFLFSIFMKKARPSHQKKRNKAQERRDEEHAVSIINSLCRGCSGVATARVLNKFMENQCEKLERLLELHDAYQAQIDAFFARREEEKRDEDDELTKQLEIDDEERKYLDACDHGLFTLQQIDSVIVRLANMGNALVTKRLVDLLNMRSIDTRQIHKVVTDFTEHMDEKAATERARLLHLLKRFEEIYDAGGVVVAEEEESMEEDTDEEEVEREREKEEREKEKEEKERERRLRSEKNRRDRDDDRDRHKRRRRDD
ncbi:beta-catenin family protein 1, putative [Toxoplasma gondii ME49]|uniref:Nuclear associated protein, putative n=3 Tax=Toxoplasma gondii TaxID=5811 RepID=B6KFA1_TOXGV|nr:beta-catenin family protein 1, putative [Toxoplasma gondii ME49]EPT30741.1 beta-catenin family protein 1, putative [Toxoplasma gondii ME49]ESS31333.1 putative beta-catenin family protein 1 [Toxoplasma gondii VEG]CEL73357.1 TPA: nuclear associated protein, putative [Toxoplasma gondii VEG]|eukprot:XP_002366632.1 beta-catenin family protein 1, putative [Toxoplasma gondii ME49]